MGLDMYLYRRNHGRVYNDMTGEVVEAKDDEIGYWRKFNALHGYIINLTDADPDSNQDDLDLNESQILEILDTLKQVRDILKDQKVDEDECYSEDVACAAADLLPPTSGFFFGSYCIDKWYYNDVLDSIDIFENALELVRNGEEVYYYSWW